MYIVIDIDEKYNELVKNGHIPYNILEILKNGKPVKETAIWENDWTKYTVYKEID